ncbi:hypothetical protein ACJIZ3_003178 [Penstemon smallii]|uniref:Uncharacterized protein n=1 Tax=Penstemon smallii TaxID=265156 RepID=A0ABD3U9X9_9LAMI
MAEVDSYKLQSLAEQYLVKEKEKEPETAAKSEEAEAKPSENVEKTEESLNVAAGEVLESKVTDAADEATDDINPTPVEESNDNAEPENSDNQEAEEETREIKIETAPADFRFPTTNQSRHCFTRYIEYHRCVAAKGEGAPECDKFAKYYRSLCPGEWVDRWNEQRENGTFPGPL